MGTGGGLRDARGLLEEYFLLIYGDSLLPIDYAGVLRKLMDAHLAGLMVIYDNSLGDTSVRNNVAIRGAMVSRYDKSGSGDAELRFEALPDSACRISSVASIPPMTGI